MPRPFYLNPNHIPGAYSADLIGRKYTLIFAVWGSLIFTFLPLWCYGRSFPQNLIKNSIVRLELRLHLKMQCNLKTPGNKMIMVELFFIMIFYYIYDSVLWIYTPEYYPTYMRWDEFCLLLLSVILNSSYNTRKEQRLYY